MDANYQIRESRIQEIISQCSLHIDEGIIGEVRRLGVIYSDPEYTKAYRRLTLDQIQECITYLDTVPYEKYGELFESLESSYNLPNSSNLGDQDKPDFFWAGDLLQTFIVKELEATGIFKSGITTGIVSFLDTLLESSDALEIDEDSSEDSVNNWGGLVDKYNESSPEVKEAMLSSMKAPAHDSDLITSRYGSRGKVSEILPTNEGSVKEELRIFSGGPQRSKSYSNPENIPNDRVEDTHKVSTELTDSQAEALLMVKAIQKDSPDFEWVDKGSHKSLGSEYNLQDLFFTLARNGHYFLFGKYYEELNLKSEVDKSKY